MELKVGRSYRAKKPAVADGQFVNDRVILWINLSQTVVQYDGPAVANGRCCPQISYSAFEKWVGEDVTETLPPGEWEMWVDYLAKRKAK